MGAHARPQGSENLLDGDGYRRFVWQGTSGEWGSDPALAAKSFVLQHQSEIASGVDFSTWGVMQVHRIPSGNVVDIRREIDGLPVYGERLRVILRDGGGTVSVIGSVARAVKLPQNSAALSAEGAFFVALGAWGTHNLISGVPEPQLAMYSTSQGWRKVWVVALPSADLARDGQVLVDAVTGEVLQRFDLAVHLTESADSVSAWVFNPDPLTTAHEVYGVTGFVDGNDSDTDSLTAQRREVFLDSVTVDGGMLTLSGPYVQIEAITGTAVPVTVQEGGSFDFTRSQSGFEDVMAYYHIDHYQRRLQALGFTDLQNGPIRVDPHASTEDNSFYYPTVNALFFGTGGIDDAEDADVLIHEYGHSLMYDAMFGVSSGNTPDTLGFDVRCIAEGYCDYLAGSYSLTLDSFGSDRVYNWDGNNAEILWFGRPLTTTEHYSDWGTGEEFLYSNGTIWADALWQARQVLSADTADAVVLSSLYYLQGDMTATEVAQQLRQAALDLFPDDPSIAKEFEEGLGDKGFLQFVSVEPPANTGVPSRFNVESPYPNPFNPSTTLRLSVAAPASVELRAWSIDGRLIETRSLGRMSAGVHSITYVAPDNVASGVILLEVDAGLSGRAVRKAVLLR